MPRTGGGIGRRLLLALTLVLVVVGVTAWVVAGAVGPPIFHEHLLYTGATPQDPVVVHAEEAFRTAGALALAIALGTAGVTALAVSLFLTRRIGASLATLTGAARRLADGGYAARVPPPAMGAEFDDLADAFNHMADRLDAAERLRRRLLSDVAHELRTPVATLTAQLEALEDGVAELDAGTVRLLRAQGERLARLADDLAAVTRAESGEMALHPAEHEPAALLEHARLGAADRAARAGVALTASADAGLPPVRVDATRMGQVLGNVVDNALRHTPAGGAVGLEAYAEDDVVVLAVTDTGEGIAEEHLPHVFERFYRAEAARDRTSGGSGIGLAIARAIVEAHGGTITAASAGAGTGARFEVRLPA